jgi:hypothetical protein
VRMIYTGHFQADMRHRPPTLNFFTPSTFMAGVAKGMTMVAATPDAFAAIATPRETQNNHRNTRTVELLSCWVGLGWVGLDRQKRLFNPKKMRRIELNAGVEGLHLTLGVVASRAAHNAVGLLLRSQVRNFIVT